MNRLPSGWVTAPIADVTVDCSQRIPSVDERFEYIDISSIDRDSKTITNPQPLLGKDAPSRARKMVQAGDTLVSMTRPNLNAVALVPNRLDGQIASTGIDVLRAPELDPRWLYYLVRTPVFVQKMSELVQGALYPAVRSKDVHGFESPFAPRDEQKRIADKLDTILARVDACRERLDRVPGILKRFRQAVLSAATSGDLTIEWKQSNDSTAWTEVEFGSLISQGPKNGMYKPASDYGRGTRILRIDNFYDGEVNSWTDLKRLNVTSKEKIDFGLSENDIVINRVNSLPFLGKSALVRDLPEPCVFESNMMRIRLHTANILPNYCILVLNSPKGLSGLRANAKHAVNQASINQTDVRSLLIPLPSIDEQTEIVRRAQSLLAYADRLESRYTTARTQVERLTPALLAKAFRGELVPQDPDDEPAAALLERIRTARAAAPTQRKRGRRAGTRNTRKAEVMMLNRKDISTTHLSDILKARGPLTAESLWSESQLDIDDFYDQLKDEEAQGLLKENRDTTADTARTLEAVA